MQNIGIFLISSAGEARPFSMNIADISCPACNGTGPKRLLRTVGDYKFLACLACSFQFIHPYMQPTQAFNDYSWTKEFTDHYDLYVGPVVKSLKAKLEDVARIIGRRPESFLDIGCGNGLYLVAANELGLKNLGTDVDRSNIEIAKSKGLNAVAAAIEELDIEDRFDFVHLKAVLHLVPDPLRLLAKAKDLMVPGGVIYIDVPNQGSLFTKLRILRDRASYGQLQLPLRRGAYNIKALQNVCRGAGLSIVKIVFAYPGDRNYYPLEISTLRRLIYKFFSMARISSLLGVYLKVPEGEEIVVGR
jgi:SAM-dependent methyltransferase